MNDVQLMGLKRYIWSTYTEGCYDLYRLCDVLSELGASDNELSHSNLERYFMMLPTSVIAGVVEWGMSDTDIFDQMYTFFKGELYHYE